MFSKSKLLILGIPRSGTTLLTAMVGAHPQVAMLNEDLSNAINNLVSKKVFGNKLCIPNQVCFETTLLSRLARRYGFYLYRDRSVISLDEYLQDEDLNVVLILRDPRANISSMIESGNLSFDRATQRWHRGIEIADQLYSQEEERTLLISFERLVQKPERTMMSVSDFLSIEFDPNMLEGWKGTTHSNRGGILAKKARTGEKVNLPGDLCKEFPESYKNYERLSSQCRPTPQ